MPLILTDLATKLSQQTNITVNIILEIEGFTHKFGAIDIKEELSFDISGKTFDSGESFDTDIVDPDSNAIINLDGTTRNITSQLSIDKGIESVKSFTVDLLDNNGLLSNIFTPGVVVDDLLGQKAQVYINFKGSTHPKDSLLIIEGVIGQYQFSNKGTCKVVIDHASQLKRQEIFLSHKTKLSGALAQGAVSAGDIDVSDASGFVVPDAGVTELETYFRVNDEIIRYTGITNNTLTGCVRQNFQTLQPTSHDAGSEVTSFYRLQGNALELALKLMLSTGGYGLSKSTTAFEILSPTLTIENAILFASKDIQEEFGLTVGDHVQITGSTSNNITTTISSFGLIDEDFSYIVVSSSLNAEDEQNATVKFKSQYDVLQEGAGMLPTQVDVSRHKFFLDSFTSNFVDLDFYLEEELVIDEFINKELYRPNNLYSVPGAKSSVKMTLPPLSDIYTKTLDSSNVINPTNINIQRSINKYHFNSYIVKYNPSPLETEKYLNGKVVIDNDSLTRIGAGKKVFKIESQGLRDSAATTQALTLNAARHLDRYKFAAEFFSIETFFSNIDIEAGDIVVVDGLNIYDSTTGNRTFKPKQFEVINKSISIGSAKIKLDLLSTSYQLDGKYGVVSPSSKIDTGATTTNIPLKKSYGNTGNEEDKWQIHIGSNIRVHNNDFSFDETTVLTGFDPTAPNIAIVSPALSSPPSADFILDSPNYDDGNTDALEVMKDMYIFVNPTLDITGVTDSSTFTVSASHAAKLFAGCTIEVHNIDYTSTNERVVSSIVGNTVNLKTALSFTPTTDFKIQLVGFSSDSGKPYRII